MLSDFISFIRGEDMASASESFVYTVPEPSKAQAADIERVFSRLFSTADGKQVLGYLQAVTFQRALGPATTDEHLRYMEGQRAMVAMILRLIDRGRGV